MGITTPALSGPVHTMFTFTGISTAGLSSTVQVRVTVVPMGRMGLVGLGMIVTDDGIGTIMQGEFINDYMELCACNF